MRSQIHKGIGLALMTMVISGVSNYVNKIAVLKIDPLVHTTVKNSLVFLMIAVYFIIFSKKGQSIVNIAKKDKLKLILIGLIGGSVPFYLYFTGLVSVPAINASIIHKSLIFWVAMIAIPVLKERLNLFHIIGIAFLFGGNFLIGGFKGFNMISGEFLILTATIFWAIENIVAKLTLKKVEPTIVAFARMGIGSLILLSIVILQSKLTGIFLLDFSQWMIIGLTSFLLFSYVMTWYHALKYAPVITVASILVGATLITNLMTVFFEGKQIISFDWQPSIIILCGVVLILLATRWSYEW